MPRPLNTLYLWLPRIGPDVFRMKRERHSTRHRIVLHCRRHVIVSDGQCSDMLHLTWYLVILTLLFWSWRWSRKNYSLSQAKINSDPLLRIQQKCKKIIWFGLYKNKWFNHEYNENKYFDPKKSSKPSPSKSNGRPLIGLLTIMGKRDLGSV